MIQKTSSIASQGGGATAFASGVSYVFGLTPAEWSVIGVIGGLVIGLAGLALNAWFQWDHRQFERGQK